MKRVVVVLSLLVLFHLGSGGVALAQQVPAATPPPSAGSDPTRGTWTPPPDKVIRWESTTTTTRTETSTRSSGGSRASVRVNTPDLIQQVLGPWAPRPVARPCPPPSGPVLRTPSFPSSPSVPSFPRW